MPMRFANFPLIKELAENLWMDQGPSIDDLAPELARLEQPVSWTDKDPETHETYTVNLEAAEQELARLTEGERETLATGEEQEIFALSARAPNASRAAVYLFDNLFA